MKHLIEEIEQCRRELIHLSDKHALSSEVVVQYSQKLDALLNSYQKHIVG